MARIEARNCMSTDYRIGIDKNLANYESQNLLTLLHGRVHPSIAQSCKKTLDVLGELQTGVSSSASKLL